MTEQTPSSPASFYDALAPDYDAMTDFEQRFQREEPPFRSLVERHGIQTALDAGSGTGFHSLLLARLGVKVTALDSSREMLRLLRQHAAEQKTAIDAVEADFQHLPDALNGRFDAVFCLGNSLAHLLTDADLNAALAGFRRVLRPGGLLILQTLNFDRILAERTTIQSVKHAGGKTFVRYYEYHGQEIIFNILTIDNPGGKPVHHLQSVALRPVTKALLLQALTPAGFQTTEAYGSITLEPFDERQTKDLVIIAHTT